MREGLSLSWNSTISIYKQYLFIFWTPLFMAHSQTLWLCTDSVRPGVLIVLSESTMQEVSFLNIISEALRVLSVGFRVLRTEENQGFWVAEATQISDPQCQAIATRGVCRGFSCAPRSPSTEGWEGMEWATDHGHSGNVATNVLLFGLWMCDIRLDSPKTMWRLF